MGWAVFPPCCLTWVQTMVEVRKIIAASSKGVVRCCTQCLRRCSRPLPAHASAGDSWTLTGKSVSLLWGHCPFLLGPGVHKALFVPSKSLFPQSCVSSWRRQWHPTPVSCLKTPWMEEPGRLQSMGSLRVRHDWATSLSLFTFTHWRRKWQPTPSSVLAWRIPGTGKPGGLPSMGSHRVRHDWSDLAAAAAV